MWILNAIDSDLINDDMVRNNIIFLNKKLDSTLYLSERKLIESEINYLKDILNNPLIRKPRSGKV